MAVAGHDVLHVRIPRDGDQRSEIPFCQGAWTLVRLGFRPVDFRKAMTSASSFESRPRMTPGGE
jgi:hypothetical protein